MRLTIGVTKKVGQPGFGSAGATCQLESGEIDGDLSNEDFKRRIRRAFDLCRSAVEEELRNYNAAAGGMDDRSRSVHELDRTSSNGNGGDRRTAAGSTRRSPPATAKQLNAIRGMAAKCRLSRIELDDVFGGRPLDGLTIAEASEAIDRLKRRSASAAAASNGRADDAYSKGGA